MPEFNSKVRLIIAAVSGLGTLLAEKIRLAGRKAKRVSDNVNAEGVTALARPLGVSREASKQMNLVIRKLNINRRTPRSLDNVAA